MGQTTRMLEVQVQYGIPRRGLPGVQRLHRAAQAAWQGGVASAQVTLRIVDAAEGQALNARFRGQDKPTNVLSFPAEAFDLPQASELLGPTYLGDIVLCAPVLAAEAEAQGKSLAAHYVHMVVHGLLHLQGFDHDTAAQAQIMEALECDILASLGYPDPYQALACTIESGD